MEAIVILDDVSDSGELFLIGFDNSCLLMLYYGINCMYLYSFVIYDYRGTSYERP